MNDADRPWQVGWQPWPEAREPPCWTCGGLPSGAFLDGSPRYSCSHAETVAKASAARGPLSKRHSLASE